MRALIVMLAMLVTIGATARADAPRATAIGYDHMVHDRKLITSGGEALPCERCHVVRAGRLVGRPDHAACFGTCHGAAPRSKVDPDRMKVCTACHAEAALAGPGKPAVAYPPYAIDPDFGITLGHKHHREIACTQCHSGAKAPPHQRCASCHDGAPGHGAAMSACLGCHQPSIGKPQPPELTPVHDSVTASFSHPKHASRGGAGKDCATCHAPIRNTDETELPRPTVKDCANCHDGRSAFATTAACTRCHAQIPDKFEVERPTARFVHSGHHEAVMTSRPCSGCHPLGPKGEPLVAGHAACVACHADDFGKRKPTICGACHNATEPWRALVADRSLPDATEFGATLSHAKHGGACASCHSLRTTSTQLRPPRGHRACATAGCHAIAGGPAPQLGSCDGCHRLGLVASRLAKRAADAWSVRTAFDHGKHDGACITCHVDLTAGTVVDLATPPKPTCAACHDGRTTFELTGTSCTRCHVGAKS